MRHGISVDKMSASFALLDQQRFDSKTNLSAVIGRTGIAINKRPGRIRDRIKNQASKQSSRRFRFDWIDQLVRTMVFGQHERIGD